MTRPTPVRSRRHPHAPWRVLVLSAVALVTVASCTATSGLEGDPTIGGTDGEAGATSAPRTPGAAATEATSSGGGPTDATDPSSATERPGADADRVAGAVRGALQALADSDDSVTRDQVSAAIEQGFAAAGTVPERIEVSIDRTPTGLDVDTIQGAGLLGTRCVVGEVREGSVSAVVLPVLATGLCFVGDQR